MIDNFFYAWPFFFQVDYYFCGLSIYGFPQTMFQLSKMAILLLSTRNPAIGRVNIGSWLRTLVKNCILQTLLVVKSTVSSSNIMNRWFQNHYNPIPVFAVSTRYMQLFISSNSDKKKLQEFTMLMYFQS